MKSLVSTIFIIFGIILNTNAQWELKGSLGLSLAYFIPYDHDSVGFAVEYGYPSNIYISTNRFDSWSVCGISTNSFQQIDYVDNRFYTLEGGKNFVISKIFSNKWDTIYSFHPTIINYDSVLIGKDSTIYSDTIFYRYIWSYKTIENKIISYKLLDSLSAIVLLNDGTLLTTHNLGKTWDKKKFSFEDLSIISQHNKGYMLFFYNGNEVTIYNTNNSTTRKSKYPLPAKTYKSHFVTDSIGFSFFSKEGITFRERIHEVYKTTNGGVDWKYISTFKSENAGITDVSFLDCNIGYIVSGGDYAGYPTKILITLDGGLTWKEQYIENTNGHAEYFQKLFIDKSFSGVLIYRTLENGGYGYKIFTTSNGGDKNLKLLNQKCELNVFFEELNTLYEIEHNENTLLAYPNPFIETIMVENLDLGSKMEILDINGVLLFTTQIKENKLLLNTNEYKNNNMYFIKGVSRGHIFIKKVFKF